MRLFALAAAILVAAGLASAYAASAPSAPTSGNVGPVLGGQVQVVAYSDDNVRICPNYAFAANFGPSHVPPCANGLPATGVDTSALTNQEPGHPERWGSLYLVGDYANGVFTVSSQSLQGPPAPPSGSSFTRPPCAAPRHGWRLVQPTQAQRHTVDHYSHLAHHHDLVDIAFFDRGDVLTLASSHPGRTRAVLGKYWPRQLCVVRARYSRKTLVDTGKTLVHLMETGDPATFGWITGAGGTGVRDNGQPTTSVEVLLETPQLQAFLQQFPQSLVVVQAALAPVGQD
jgi:hypothetical protein